MTLEDGIKNLARKHVSRTNDWYKWRPIKESSLPNGINLPQGNQYEKNMALKNQLHKQLKQAATHEVRKNLFKYYISTWGGIHGNSEATLDKYTRATTSELIAMGSNGIASWSKALCIYKPDQFAIFDARVSASLNALQIINKTENREIYPVLVSRNNVIKKGIKLFKAEAKKKDWSFAAEDTFYRTYLSFLNKTASSLDKQLGASIATIEMLLFAKGEDLVKEAFPNEQF